MIFHADKQRGSHLFALYFAALTIPADTRSSVTAQFLGVTQKTLALWLSGKREPPTSSRCSALARVQTWTRRP